MRSTANKQSNKLIRILFAPFKFISKARYLYMKSMWKCAGRVGNGNFVGGPTSQIMTLPKSFSSKPDSNSNNDAVLKGILDSLAKKRIDDQIESNMDGNGEVMKQTTLGSSGRVGRSYSVGVGKIGRIDEDKPCSFREDHNLKADSYARSKSYAVSRKSIEY
ncbi:unnamed protein product [Dovyalis caffra]|uniref:Uncharacterized protein n=1 Tax=Dovyalis caffra TaxID=77055 RepID=A0AAV1RAR9_9ROSI|nr:unnamed protein product [Dovyalis caffra]